MSSALADFHLRSVAYFNCRLAQPSVYDLNTAAPRVR